MTGRPRHRIALVAAAVAGGAIYCAAAHAAGISEILQGMRWGEPGDALVEHFGHGLSSLRRPIDFGDSYATLVLRHAQIGGVPLVVFFQMDKATGRLKRIQIERQRHGVDPPAFRAVVAGLRAEYGSPDAMCDIAPGPASGYQAATELVWSRDGDTIRAIFRDTTIEAFEGCLAGDPSLGPCGLTGQLLVRISQRASDASACAAPPATR